MTKSECRMTKEFRKPDDQLVGRLCQTPWRFAETPYNHSSFVISSSFVLRAPSFQ
jgi:hypothetical protein